MTPIPGGTCAPSRPQEAGARRTAALGPGVRTLTNARPLFSQNQLSGYLLRKFKNSTGWQKLWVVFTNFCLFFYKTHQVGGLTEQRAAVPVARGQPPLLAGPSSHFGSEEGGLTILGPSRPVGPSEPAATGRSGEQGVRGGPGQRGERPHSCVLPSRMTTHWPASRCWATA